VKFAPSGFRGGRGLGGMEIFPLISETAKTNPLFVLSLGVTTAPSLDPFSTPSSVSRRNPALGRCAP